MQLHPGAEGEEGEVVEGAEGSIMEEATAKEVKTTDTLYVQVKTSRYDWWSVSILNLCHPPRWLRNVWLREQR